jgi:hypothetical protein
VPASEQASHVDTGVSPAAEETGFEACAVKSGWSSENSASGEKDAKATKESVEESKAAVKDTIHDGKKLEERGKRVGGEAGDVASGMTELEKNFVADRGYRSRQFKLLKTQIWKAK